LSQTQSRTKSARSKRERLTTEPEYNGTYAGGGGEDILLLVKLPLRLSVEGRPFFA
jgi:hypothetical protein